MRPLILLLIVSVIAGCGCGDTPPTTTTSNQPPADSDLAKAKSNNVVEAPTDSGSSSDDVQNAASQLADGSQTEPENGSTITQTSHEKSAELKGVGTGKSQDIDKKKPEETEVIED